MIRRAMAFLVFNLYSGCFVWAFQVNTAYQFDSQMIERLKGSSDFDTPAHWGWGNHYIWRLMTSVVATAFAGILAGAIARSRAGLTVSLANIPSVTLSIWMVYYLMTGSPPIAYGDEVITNHTGMIVSMLLSIPLTTYVAYTSGKSGAKLQLEEFNEGTVLGIAGYHWAWLVIPIYVYAVASIIPIMNFFSFNFLHSDESFISGALSLVLLITAIASFFPVFWVYMNLRVPANSVVNVMRRALANTGILAIGLLAVCLVQLASHWLLGKVTLISASGGF